MDCCLILALRVKQEHKAIADLMKLSFLSAQVKSNFQPFGDGLIKRRGAWRFISLPECGDSNSCGMPMEVRGFSNRSVLESLLEEAAESSACGCHATSFGTEARDGNRLRDFLINLSRGETRLDGLEGRKCRLCAFAVTGPWRLTNAWP